MNDDRERARALAPADASGSAPPDATSQPFFDREGHIPADTLARYIDEPRSFLPAESDRIAAHLSGCADCRTALDELRTVMFALRALPQVAPRRSFALAPGQVARAQPVVLQETPQWVERWLPRVRAMAATAAVLFVLVLAADVVGRLGGTTGDDDGAAMPVTQSYASGAAAEPTATSSGAAARESDQSTTATVEEMVMGTSPETGDDASLAAQVPTEAAGGTPQAEATSAAAAPTTAASGAEPTPASQATATSGGGAEATPTPAAQTPPATAEPTATPAAALMLAPTETPAADTFVADVQPTEVSQPERTSQPAGEDHAGRDSWKLIELGLALVFIWMLAAMIALPRLTRRAGK